MFFEVANISCDINFKNRKNKKKLQISQDISEYITQTPNYNNSLLTTINVVENCSQLKPVLGKVLYSDSNRIVLKQENGKEARIFLTPDTAEPYGVYREMDDDSIQIECTSNLLKSNTMDMRILEMLCFEKRLLKESAVILHACCIEYQGEAIVFTAPSGTGKSTQGDLWMQNEDAELINGDRCIIQKRDNKFFACGNPFCGSSNTNKNKTLPLRAVVIVNQNKFDYVRKANYKEAVAKLNPEFTVNRWNPEAVTKVFSFMDELYQQVHVLNLFCTPTVEAVKALKEYLYDK